MQHFRLREPRVLISFIFRIHQLEWLAETQPQMHSNKLIMCKLCPSFPGASSPYDFRRHCEVKHSNENLSAIIPFDWTSVLHCLRNIGDAFW